MTKYDEIMEKITLSPEAKDRIIDNVADELSSDEGYASVRVNRTRSKAWRKYVTAAACCILVAAGAVAAARSNVFIDLTGRSSDSGSEAAYSYSNELSMEAEEEITDLKDADVYEDEMPGELGFSMDCPPIRELSEKSGMTEVSYNVLDGNIGEIVFSDGEHSNYFRKAAGTEDISGDYNVYDSEVSFDGEYSSGTLKGKEDDYQLAVWTTEDGFTYAAYVEDGLTDSEWQNIIDSLNEDE